MYYFYHSKMKHRYGDTAAKNFKFFTLIIVHISEEEFQKESNSIECKSFICCKYDIKKL